jgi:hypothetical protein
VRNLAKRSVGKTILRNKVEDCVGLSHVHDNVMELRMPTNEVLTHPLVDENAIDSNKEFLIAPFDRTHSPLITHLIGYGCHGSPRVYFCQ